tara:strand:+ start:271 stop:885 length:615 start_codon:yes stop_codon:yes gene_type:complete
MVIIYALEENNVPYYIGYTTRTIRERKREHKHKLKKQITQVIIDEVEDSEWRYWEKFWIEQYINWGFKLINKNKGGGGVEKHTELSKKKIGDSMRGQKRPTTSAKLKGKQITWDLGTSIPILQFDLDGNLIDEHISMGQAYNKTGVPTGAICLVCKGVRRKAHGFIWMYKNDWDGTPPKIKQHKSKGKPSGNPKGRPKKLGLVK